MRMQASNFIRKPYGADFRDPASELVCVWPLHTPPTDEDLERINIAHEYVGRTLNPDEVLNLIIPRGRA